ncbi:putative F1F0 ATP synthase assembly protein Atp11 [Aspergillus taichungensis]|uniref:Putative F1F0 ATP synthase assembly protein Atp11 n=1 Tax=Aspergillus taichungensis TaxID=482145 RepID=A0A2J5HNZ3_9EURO|nr:putative F1F0 ATP synthase assembly protein Atp11 [Aspergillus taichungensis]
MASLRTSAFPSLIRARIPLLRHHQRRWAQVHDVRFLATHHDPNHVLDKYRAKLDQKAKSEGHGSIESLKDAYQDKISDLRQQATTPITPDDPAAPQKPSAVPPPPPAAPSPLAEAAETSKKASGIKPLSAYLDVEKIRDLPAKEIEALWRLRHASSADSICAVIPLDTYQRIAAAARQNPQFILPLPRSPSAPSDTPASSEAGSEPAPESVGADIHFLQWGFHPPATAPSSTVPSGPRANSHTSTVIFTQLAAYKLHGAYAQPHTTLTHHLDLADETGLVLMHGQVMPNGGVSTSEATWLTSCLQRFYDFGGQAHGRKGELLRMFTQGDVQGFKIDELLAEAEKL